MPKLTILTHRCKGCMLCTTACPKRILARSQDKPNEKGYYPVVLIDPDACIGCGMCAMMCPDCVISVEK